MQISILGIGETKSQYLKEGEKDFLKRLKHYCPVNTQWIRGNTKRSSSGVQLTEEAKLLETKLNGDEYLVILDVRGEQMSSETFSKRLERWRIESRRKVCFIIGGPNGIAPALLKKADLVISLSKMTFTHDMVRLILLEQLYRAFTILKGEKYHK